MAVFDMDNTLLALATRWLGFALRPHAVETLLALHATPNVRVVLWSAGSPAYVHNIVDVVLMPALLAKNPLFRFSSILTLDDTSNNGTKDLRVICEAYKVPKDRVILVDDSALQCEANASNGFRVVAAPPFDPANEGDDFMLGLWERMRIRKK